MPTTRLTTRLLAFLSALVAANFTLAQDSTPSKTATKQAPDSGADQSKYIRTMESNSGEHIGLQVSVRSFKPSEPNLPVVHLVGVVHIGDQAYYDQLQNFLDQQDLVLFEGVKPGGAESDLTNADDAAKAKLTKARQRMLAVLLTRHKKKHGEYPASLDDLVGKLPGTTARLAASAVNDAWGHPQEYSTMKTNPDAPLKFDIVSKGSDGATGGEGAAADIKFSEQKPLTKSEKEGGEGIQTQLADAMGLKFQLAALDYTRPKWRNSDLTIDQVQAKMEETGANADALFSLLDGQSFAGAVASFMLGFVKSSPQLSLSMKVMMVEMLAHADDMIAAQGKLGASGGAGGVGAGMANLMKVLIQDRNAEVFRDLKRVMETEKAIKSVAIFFGAGHLPDMEKTLTSEMGYTFDADRWFTAIDIDFKGNPGAAAQAKQMREMIKSMTKQEKAGE